MSKPQGLQIPEDLKDEHRIFSTGKNVRPTAERHVQLIERIARVEAELAAAKARIDIEADRNYINGARMGYNLGVNEDSAGLEKLLRGRRKEILAARATEGHTEEL